VTNTSHVVGLFCQAGTGSRGGGAKTGLECFQSHVNVEGLSHLEKGVADVSSSH